MEEPTKKKLKLLLLTHADYNLAGHGYYDFLNLPDDKFEKRIVMNYTFSNSIDKAIYKFGSIRYFLHRVKYKLVFQTKSLLKYGRLVLARKNKPEYCFYSFDGIHLSSKKILNKMGRDYRPDLILVYHTPNFLNMKVIYELHQQTKAHVVFMFVDQEHMTGGCHYPVDCDGYTMGCFDCPSCSVPSYPKDQFKRKFYYLNKIPHSIVGSPWDCMLAKQKSLLFKGCKTYNLILSPKIEEGSRNVGRKRFDISDDAFVVLIAANSINDKRKGFAYALEAIREFSVDKSNVVLLALGNVTDRSVFDDINAKLILPGYLNLEGMCAAFYASDVFVNTPVADSGPMMVNYSLKMGIPVVSFKVGIAWYLIKNGINGYLSELGEISGIVHGLELLYGLNDIDKLNMNHNSIKYFERETQYGWWDRLYNDFVE